MKKWTLESQSIPAALIQDIKYIMCIIYEVVLMHLNSFVFHSGYFRLVNT